MNPYRFKNLECFNGKIGSLGRARTAVLVINREITIGLPDVADDRNIVAYGTH
jgi:hypothetical protein